MKIKSAHIGVGLAVLASFGGGWLLCSQVYKEQIALGEKFKVFNTIEETLPESYDYKIVNEGMALEDCINAYYANSGDKYFEYSFDGSVKFREELLNGSHLLNDGGFKIEANAEGTMTVTEVEEGSYAEQQGLKVGDIITKIGDTDIKEETFAIGGKELLGENGSTAELTIVRGDETIHLSFVRKYEVEQSPEPSMIDEKICYIPFKGNFSDVNYTVFEQAYEEFGGEAEAYIIDIRNNGGGHISTAMEILGYFVGERQIAKEIYFDGTVNELKSGSKGKCYDKPVVLLVNKYTGSASEIFTAAMMQFYDDVTVVGENTYGKGIFQVEQYLEGEDTLKYTAGYYTVGDWECYQDVGIAPDIEVKMAEELVGSDEDVQLQRAIELLS